ncbi:hypothetical protein ACJJTC_019044 [Scirpophaga incertulas]
MSEMTSPKDAGETVSPGNLRRFRSVSTRLNMCSVTENTQLESHQRRVEMQNSPRILECSSAKEKSSALKFDFSPKLLAESMSSPRFFTPPETVSPAFFAEPSPKSVYYDTVRSPKFFPETPRDTEVPQSPRALGANLNRNNSFEKPSSPLVLSAKPSPKIYSCNKENYFTFEPVTQNISEEVTRATARPKKYGGRNSIERERFTSPADKEIKKYRRHNSCDTNYRNIELNVTNAEDNKTTANKPEVIDKDVVDCCAKVETLKLETKSEDRKELTPAHSNTAQARRQRLKSISLDSDNAKIIEQNLGLPIAKQIKDQMNEAYKNQDVSTSCESMERREDYQKSPSRERPVFKFDDEQKDKTPEEDEPKSPDLKQKKCLRHSSDTQSFIDMPRFSPKEFEITVTSEEGATAPAETQIKRKGKNLRNLTIDLTKRDSELEKELLEFEKLYTDAEEKKVKTPTLKVKATSLDSSETVNLSLPQKKTLEVPQNSVSVPNTPKRQLKRILGQKIKPEMVGGKIGYNSIQSAAEQRRLYMKGQDSGIFLRENHATLMLYQPGPSRMGSRTMGSFEENVADLEKTPEINILGADNRYQVDAGATLGSNLLNYKQNLSVSSTNLKTLPEGVPSDDFEPSAEDEKLSKKLHRRNSNQSLMLSTHSLQSSNCSLSSAGASCHNLATVRTSLSNFSLNSDGRQKKLSLERRDSNTSLLNAEHLTPTTRGICSSNANLTGDMSKNCLLQRRGSNNSLTLNIQSTNTLSRHSSNSSLNKDVRPGQKKGLLERRSSNTSLTLNINNSNPQLSVNRGLSISNYNLNGSTCNLSRYNSNHSIDNPGEPRKGILERRSSNTSLTLNIQPQEPRDLEIDESLLEPKLKDLPHKDKHRKSLSTENLIPKSYKTRTRLKSNEKCTGFGSHDNLWSSSYNTEEYPQNLTYVCGDQENEIIYAFGARQEDPNFQPGFIRNITTKPLSPQSTSEDFRLYLANMQHLQNASSVLTRQQLKDLNDVFQNGYSKVKCHSTSEGQHCCSGRVEDMSKDNPQMMIPDLVPSQPCSEYQKTLLRNLHQEFWDMPTNFQEKPIVSGSHPKNRYKTILPNEHSRFILRGNAGTGEGYINANFIKGHEYSKNSYIATQGPLQNTMYDFWLMIYQNNVEFNKQPPDVGVLCGVQKVVMLTNFIENNRQKCEKYFPLEVNEELTVYSTETADEADTPSFIIKNGGIKKKSGYTIRKLGVKYKRNESDSANESVSVYHYWFHNWADHKCPKDVNALLNLSLDVLKDVTYDFDIGNEEVEELCKCESSKVDSKFIFPPLEAQSAPCDIKVNISTPLDFTAEQYSPPTIVHCSAGIGRTGCLIAILNGIKQLSNEQKVDVLGIVCNMRLNRGGMVQNSEQYELIHKVLCLYEQACLPSL